MELNEMIEQLSIPEEAMSKFYELMEEVEKYIDKHQNEKLSSSKCLDRYADHIFELENLMKDLPKTTFEGREEYVKSYYDTVNFCPAEQVYLDLLLKVAGAPTRLHIMASIKNLIPIIADKLRERKENK